MKHSLQLTLSQHLTLTPQLQQSIRLLQLSTVELNQELERYLAENPLLERTDAGLSDEPTPPPPLNGCAPATETPAEPQEQRDESASFSDDSGSFGEDSVPRGTAPSRDDDDRDDFTQYAAAVPTL